MVKRLLTRIIYLSVKEGVKESAAYFAEFLIVTKRELKNLHPEGNLEDALAAEGASLEDFTGIWVKSAIEGYIDKYPPKTELQKSFYSSKIRPYQIGLMIKPMSPSIIPNVILEYGYSEFFGLCGDLIARGDALGAELIEKLEQIIFAEFRIRGIDGEFLHDQLN